MHKIKEALTDATNEAKQPHPVDKGSSVSATDSDYHPIYDQFSSSSRPTTSGEPAGTIDQPPSFPNSASLKQTPPSTSGAFVASGKTSMSSAPNMHPDSAHPRPSHFNEEMSTSSIKSGVIGFPQGSHDTHAALGNNSAPERSLDGDQILGGGTDRATTHQPGEGSYSERNPALSAGAGAGAVGAGAFGAEELNRRREGEGHRDHTTPETTRAFDRSTEPSSISQITQRDYQQPNERHRDYAGVSQPLADRSTHQQPTERHRDNVSQPTYTESTQPLTDTSAQQGYQQPSDRLGEDSHLGRNAALGAGTVGAGGLAAHELHRRREGDSANLSTQQQFYERSLNDPNLGTSTNRSLNDPNLGTDTDRSFPLAGGVSTRVPTANTPNSAVTSSTLPPSGNSHESGYNSQSHTVPGSVPSSETAGEHHGGLLYKYGPYTDGVHAAPGEPHLHIPGAFPGHTPMDELSQPSYPSTATSGTTATPDQHKLHHTGTLDHPRTTLPDQTRSSSSEYGTEPQSVQTNTSPYSSTQLDPRVSTNTHHGRDAALVGGALGGAGLAAHGTGNDRQVSKENTQPSTSGPASSTVGPHQSNVANVIDPRVKPNLESQHQDAPVHKSSLLNRLDPRVDPKALGENQHHHGSEAAAVGGAGAAGYGAHQTTQISGQPHSTQPVALMNEQRYDPTAPRAHDPTKTSTHPSYDPNESSKHHYGRDAAIGGGLGAAGAGLAHQATGRDASVQPPLAATQDQRHQPLTQIVHDPRQPSQHQQYNAGQVISDPSRPEHHYGRDAAIVGGLGATGAGVYAASRPDKDDSRQLGTGQAYQQPDINSPQHHDSIQDPHNQNQKRDTALGAGAVTAGGAGAAFGYSQHEAEKDRLAQLKVQEKEAEAQRKAQEKELEHQHKEQQKELEHDRKEQEKAAKHHQKEVEKEQAHEQKHHAKVVAAGEKAHEKEAEKDAIKHQKEAEKEAHRRQKEAEKQEEKEEKKEKKHGLFGFLHRDKKDKHPEDKTVDDSPRLSRDNPRHSRELAATSAGAAGVGTTAAAYEGIPSLDPSLDPDSKHNKLHKDPPPGHPAREALEQLHHQEGGNTQHMGTDGRIGDSNQISGEYPIRGAEYGAHPAGSQKHTVIEPTTGLPMNVEKYGDGRGGTDGSKNIGGYHQGSQGQSAGQGSVTDWEGIKKANTPY
ncbi:hypothetical protein BDV95DRAFT_323577 [Massariosphaeria phaeospora]|uniref:Uncharacterized protein n=1 Tax=Massariosphaeria phaeospora TaxID=100035 RepID=A0A7C8MB97_9PLEO|nr:hypothetical protein BDV95DRAFT_323577 [Massariosphaeria phaeospora]